MKATEKDIRHIEALYRGRRAFHGDLHNHAATGGTSDGKCSLSHWKEALAALGMDFVAILDHKQVRHMYLPEWEDGLFLGGTEPATVILDSTAEDAHTHYNMIFPTPKALMDLLENHPEYEFTGGIEGHFIYPRFTRAEFGALMDEVRARDGFFVIPHPKKSMKSNDPLEYWFRDRTGIEVFYGDMHHSASEENYKLWCDLLALGKRVWACSGEDGHACAKDTALTVIYAEEKTGTAFLSHLREGDFVCGSVGLKMCIGETKMGGQCHLDGNRLVLAVGDFHRSVKNPAHTFRLDLITDRGVEVSREILCTEPAYLALDTEDRKFYRAEIVDTAANLRIAIGNPIWNE